MNFKQDGTGTIKIKAHTHTEQAWAILVLTQIGNWRLLSWKKWLLLGCSLLSQHHL